MYDESVIAMLCALFTMATISSCTFDFVNPDNSSSSKQEESSIVDITPPENNPQNSSSSDVNADMGGSEGLKVIATMNDGTTKEVDVNDCKIFKPNMMGAGSREVSVTYY